MTKAEAVRILVGRGLDYEAGELVATDGGVEELREELQERERAQRKRDALLSATVIAGVAAIVFPNPVVLGIAAIVALANIASAGAPLLHSESDEGVSADV